MYVQIKLPLHFSVQTNMSAARPTLVKHEPSAIADRAFWIAVRQALLLIVSAIERRHLRHASKHEIGETAQGVLKN